MAAFKLIRLVVRTTLFLAAALLSAVSIAHFDKSPIAIVASAERSRISIQEISATDILECEAENCLYVGLPSGTITVNVEVKNVSDRSIELREMSCSFTDYWESSDLAVRLLPITSCPTNRVRYRKLKPQESFNLVLAVRLADDRGDEVPSYHSFRLGYRTHVADDGRYYYETPDERTDYSPDGAGPFEVIFWSNQVGFAVVDNPVAKD